MSRNIIIGIDPGNTHSAGVLLIKGEIANHAYLPNKEFMEWIWLAAHGHREISIVCEMIASYGMAVGKTIFDTCVFIGHIQANFPKLERVTRIQVKSTICHSGKAKDANIRQALIDLYGPAGTKKNPGPTYGISGDVWAALAVATAFRDGCKTYDLAAT